MRFELLVRLWWSDSSSIYISLLLNSREEWESILYSVRCVKQENTSEWLASMRTLCLGRGAIKFIGHILCQHMVFCAQGRPLISMGKIVHDHYRTAKSPTNGENGVSVGDARNGMR